jgi:DNA gyrase subunit A
MQTVFGINMVGLLDGQPRLLNLKDLLEAFLRHRREVVTRRTLFELRKARERAHLVEGLAIALANIDEMITLIKASPTPAEAKTGLMARPWASNLVEVMLERAGEVSARPEGLDPEFGQGPDGYRLSPAQAQAILDLRLHRLTALEQDKLLNEYRELLDTIRELGLILADPGRLMAVIREELTRIRAEYADPRRTEILTDHLDLSLEDLITPQEVVVTLTHQGYAKSQPVDQYQAQRRGGRGKNATAQKEEDFIDTMFVANTHDTLLCFSSLGKVYWLKVYELPQGSRGARGKPIVNLLPLGMGERITAILPIKEFTENSHVFMATRGGTVKKTPLSEFSRPRTSGIIAILLKDDDRLVDVALTDGATDVMLFTDAGKAIRFPESEVRSMGRAAGGIRGIKLGRNSQVIGLLKVGEGTVLTVAENGFGKRTRFEDFPVHGRGGQGVIALQTSERNGRMVAAVRVNEDDQVMLLSSGGALVRTPVAEISVLGRNTQGVRVIKLDAGERLCAVDRVICLDEEGNGDDLI